MPSRAAKKKLPAPGTSSWTESITVVSVIAVIVVGLGALSYFGHSTQCRFDPQPNITAYEVALLLQHQEPTDAQLGILLAAHPDLHEQIKCSGEFPK
jgi:hypothetical protein